MRVIISFVLLALVLAAPYDIYSRPIQTSYDEFGSLNSFLISWKPMAAVCSHCLLQITFPNPIHTASTPLIYSIINENDLPVILNANSMVPTSNVYYFTIGSDLQAEKWYVIQIQTAVLPTINYGLVGLSVVSGIIGSNIIYDSNNAFQYYYLETIVLPPLNIQLSPTSVPITSAAQSYPFTVTFNSSYTTTESIMLSFTFTNQNYSLLSSASPLIQNNNFKMIGSCQMVCNNINCIQPLFCIVQNNQIQLSLPYLDNLNHTLSFTMMNPNFADTTGIAALLHDNNGALRGIGIANNIFSVSPISIIAAGVNLHWGIPLSVAVGSMGLGLFKDGGWNTIDVGFTLSDIIGIGSQFVLSVYVGASFVLEQSINTNIANLNGTSGSQCKYSSPYITCHPIDSFTSTSLRYYIAFKAYFSSADNIAALGSISIQLLGVASFNLFNSLSQNLAIPLIPWANYHDTTGFHAVSNRISETQVIGTPDMGLANSTSTFMNNLFINPVFIGIDPSIPNQQLIFLLKTISNQMSLLLPLTSQTYQMNVFINPKVFKAISPKGIDFAAYSQSFNSFRQDAVSCYVNSSTNPQIQIYQCQAYNDYVYNTQKDNTYINYGSYGRFKYVCGNGQVVVCPTGQSCAQSCRIFKGKGTANGQSGVFSIRNVTFIDKYQSSFLADNMTLDFIISFYHNGNIVSASLINAYTINSARLTQLVPKFYNTYLSATQTNDGKRMPSLLSLEGHLTIKQINSNSYDSFIMFISNQISVNKYVEQNGRIGCSNQCNGFSLVPSPFVCRDNWICKQGVMIKGVINMDSSINIKFPIQVLSSVMGSIDLALLVNSQIISIYRLNGSAIQQLLTPTNSPIVQTSVYTNAWTSSNYWVNTLSDVYNQGINLNLIAPFSPYNTIDYKGSVLSYSGSPSMTFTSAYESIFSSYSSAVGNFIKCDKSFTYRYQSLYNVSVLWCPLINAAINPVNISYPLYPNNLGAGFPFSTMFAYGFSDGNGKLVAYRTQSLNSNITNPCSTFLSTTYNYGQIIGQVIDTTLAIPSLQLSPSTYTSVRFIITTPSSVPLTFQSCQINQILINYQFTCSIMASTTTSATLQINYSGIQLIQVIQFSISIVVLPASAPTVSTSLTYFYSYQVLLPQTDVGGTVAVFYGSTFSPFNSLVASCSNIFSLINLVAINQNIMVSNMSVAAVALNYLSDISFNVRFSTSRLNLMTSSQITIKFTNAVTTGLSSCIIWTPQMYQFLQQIISVNSISLKSYQTIFQFSTISYNILCTNLILQLNNPLVQVLWTDGGNTLQLSNILSVITNYPVTTSIVGVITTKNYNSLGFDSQYKITLSLSTNLGDAVEVWFDINSYHVHTFALQCYYSLNNVKTQVYCAEDWKGKVHLIFQASSSANIIIWIFGIKQDSTVGNSYRAVICINNLNYFTAIINEAFPPSLVTSQPILLTKQVISSTYCLQLTFVFPIAYNSVFYLELDDLFLLSFPQVISCTINGVSYPCLRNTPNIIQIYSTYALTANTAIILQVCQLIPTNLDLYDSSRIYFKMFILSGIYVSLGSYQKVNQNYLASSLPLYPLDLLDWSEVGLNTSWITHIIYIGYYGRQVYLKPRDKSPFNSNLSLDYVSQNLVGYLNSSTFIGMGTMQLPLDVAASSYLNANQMDYLIFNSSLSPYAAFPYLDLFISGKLCQITLQNATYDLYPSGITIPILLDFSNCRPAVTHYVNFTISSPGLNVDTSLTNQQVDASNPQVYVVVRQTPFDSSLNGLFTLKASLWGTYNNSYLPIPSVNIKVNAGTILQIPESLYPVINQLNNSFINLTAQCNQVSTIYWVLGLYPTMLGVTSGEIQAFLISDLKGLRRRVTDPYSWSKQIYGFDYEQSPNVNKFIIFDNLFGSSNYMFKYFCVNQLGFSSAGQIITFNTNSSEYQLTKITLKYPNVLTIDQANRIACYIAEVLLTPYSTVMTSTFSNCVNTSIAFYPLYNSTYYDGYQDNLYQYQFYVDSLIVTSTYVRYNLASLLSKYSPYISTLLASSTSFTINPLTNNYDPIIQKTYFSSSVDTITFIVDVGVPNSYLVAGYLNTTFDPQNMSLPSQHLIKQGLFSAGNHFNQVYMKYGSNNITIDIKGLQSHQNYSLYYYVTVDNPAINSKWTKVYYSNIQTSIYTFYDLSTEYIGGLLILIILLWI